MKGIKERFIITESLDIDFPQLDGNPELVYKAKLLRNRYIAKHITRFEELEHKTEEQLERMDMSMTEMEVLYTTQAAGLIRALKNLED